MQQVQSDQLALFRLQTQLSTGRRFERPGEDPIASGRIMSLQSLLERKEQVQTNLKTNQSFLSATDTAMSTISSMLADVRGAALAVVGTTASEEQRAAAAMQVNEAITQLLDAGNQNFRGRYLFAGSTTLVRPFQLVGDGVVEYLGNEQRLLSYSDVDLLFETNVDGSYVFGAVSEPVCGSVDLNPVLTFDTRLADLRGGQGVSSGSIAVSDGTHTSIVDISGAATIGEVAQLIRDNPPQGRTLEVEITNTGLNIRLNQDAPGDLSVKEVGRGTTANELGILAELGVGLATIEGDDLDPILRKTTRLDDLLGSRARSVVRSPGNDNDFILEANRNGADLNGVTIRFVDDPAVTFGNETVTYDAATGEIVVGIDEGNTQAQHVVAAINAAGALGTIPFSARLDPLDQKVNPGTGLIVGTPVGETAGTTACGSGVDFDRDSGLQIENGGKTHTVRFNTARTLEDVLNILNGAGAGVLAEINQDFSGINVRSRLSGADFAIGENGGTTAAELGLRTFTRNTRLEDMNHGLGVFDADGVGARAEAGFDWGTNTQLTLRAKTAGTQWNDYQVRFVDSGGGTGSEFISWDTTARTITVGVVPDVTTANQVIQLFETSDGPRDQFDLFLDKSRHEANNGNGAVRLATETTTGGTAGGTDFIITRRDGVELEIDIAGLETIEEVLQAINTHAGNADGRLAARLATHGNGIELVDDSLGDQPLKVRRTLLSTAAIDLGLVPRGQESASARFAGTLAMATVDSPGADNALTFRAQYPGTYANQYRVVFENTGTESFVFDQTNKILRFQIDTLGGTTARDLIDLFQADPDASALFTMELNPADGNDGSGAVAETDPLNPPALSGGNPAVITGDDANPAETQGVFTALLRLETALKNNDLPEIERAMAMLDSSVTQLNFVRAELGSKQQGLDILSERLDAEEIELRSVLSEEHDVDIVEVISNLTARQMALEAGMKATAQALQMTLLNYL
jgi:flagellin-like hook-associated protein FlgL